MKTTILTPTMNRAYTLNRLYNSLKNQTNYNFEWLIIDDGSTDNTKEVVSNFIKENKFPITYIYQENGGKHRALNKGISIINSEMTFIVDSDDYLTDNAIERIEYYCDKYKNNDEICSFSFLRGYPNGKINGDKYVKDEYIGNYIDDRINKHNRGDKAEVYVTKYLKEVPFIEIENEKFLVESYVWIQLAIKYKTVYINETIYIGDYLEDGLTKNMHKIRYYNPKGMIETCRIACNCDLKINIKIKYMIKYIAYSIIDKRKIWTQYKNINNKMMYIITIPLGIIYYIYILTRIKK